MSSIPRTHRRTMRTSLAILVVVVAGALLLVHLSKSPQPMVLDLSSMGPGSEQSFLLDKRQVRVSVPAGEGQTFGSFTIESPALGYHSGPIERDGSLETIWIDQVLADPGKDAVIVIRSGGSGSYVDIHVLEWTSAGFLLHRLPSFSDPGYMGHDKVEVVKGRVVRSFPTYEHAATPRVDRQWKPGDAMHGELPVKKQPDSNADPSGQTRFVYYDFGSSSWMPGRGS